MRNLVLILIVFIALATFITAMDFSANDHSIKDSVKKSEVLK
jgi:hypothetical protein